MRDLLETAFGAVPLLREALEHVAGVEAVAIFGSFAQRLADRSGPPPADVDVLVIGSPELSAVYVACRQVAREVDRPVNPTVFSLDEWRGDDYRVIYRIALERHCVEVVAIEHRSDAYRSR